MLGEKLFRYHELTRRSSRLRQKLPSGKRSDLKDTSMIPGSLNSSHAFNELTLLQQYAGALAQKVFKKVAKVYGNETEQCEKCSTSDNYKIFANKLYLV